MAKKSNAARIRNYILDYPEATVQQIADKFNTTKATVYVIRWKMKKDGVVPGNTLAHKKTTLIKAPTQIELFEPKADPVNHPAHYKTGGIETIDFIEAKKLGYNLGNVVKYITRADHKGNRRQDLEKAKWYLERELSSL